MKKVLKIIGGIFLAAYVVVAIVLTVLLLNYNKYNVTEINGNTFIIVKDEELKPSFQKGDLVIVKRNAMKEVEIGDKIFFYDIYEGNVSVNLGTVVNKEEVTRKELMDKNQYKYNNEWKTVFAEIGTAKAMYGPISAQILS